MAGMEPDEFYEAFVKVDHEDWQDEPHSMRKAFHVAVSAFHLADHFCRYHQRTTPTFRKRFGADWEDDDGLKEFQKVLRKEWRSFKAIQDMATAYKHLYTRARCEVSSAGSIEFLEYDGLTIVGDCAIVITHRNGTVTKFETAISDVMDMWQHVLELPDPATVGLAKR
jgi:hypothetical protein